MLNLDASWNIRNYQFCGENGLLLYFAGASLAQQNTHVTQCFHFLSKNVPDWVTDLVPSFDSLLVVFDTAYADHYAALQLLCRTQQQGSVETTKREYQVAVNYSLALDYDLTELAKSLNVLPQRIIELHCAQPLRVYAIGFAPGFAYLGELPDNLQVSRRRSPRTHVPAGAVAIADSYSAVYPEVSPGGWNLLGQVADLAEFQQLKLQVGDSVHFYPDSIES